MTEPTPPPPELAQEPREPAPEDAYGNNVLALLLLGLAILLFAGTFLVGLAYLALD